MLVIGIALVYASYVGILQGLFWITGKNVGFAQLFGSTWPPDVPSAAGTGNMTPTAPPGGKAAQGTNKPTYPTPTGNAPTTNLGTALGIDTGQG